eukprot:g36732.t1
MSGIDYVSLGGGKIEAYGAPSGRLRRSLRVATGLLGLFMASLLTRSSSFTSFSSSPSPSPRSDRLARTHPKQGAGVSVESGLPPGGLQLLSPPVPPKKQRVEPPCLFMPPGLMTDLEALYPTFWQGALCREGWFVGGKPSLQSPKVLRKVYNVDPICIGCGIVCFLTGDAGDVVEGKLCSWLSPVTFKERIADLDRLYQFDPQQPDRGPLRRLMLDIVRKDGTVIQASTYLETGIHRQVAVTDFPASERVHFAGLSVDSIFALLRSLNHPPSIATLVDACFFFFFFCEMRLR